MENTKHYFRLKGKTAESIVQKLAQKTFLTDWCYLNPMLSKGRELCDLLVVFDNVAIIWQIKNLKLNEKGEYQKSKVYKNLNQLFGAKRQLFQLKKPVELINARRKEEVFDPVGVTEVFLISVLFGEGEDYFSALEEVQGQYVHVFDQAFTEVVLNELDTISDFCKYLREKEKFFSKKERNLIINGGEEELLALYIRGGRSFKDYEKADKIYVNRGAWDILIKEPQYIKKKELDKISYGWDSIIDRIHEGSSKYEIVARELARSNRFERRYLSKIFLDAYVIADKVKERDLFRRIIALDGITYCFLFMDDPEPRERRRNMLSTICYFARGKFLQNKKVLGIATEKQMNPTCTYDYIFVDKPNWTSKDQKWIEKIQKETDMFVSPKITRAKEDEFPV